MITDLKPYPAYKDSGVAWLGQVPEHWEIRRTKTVLRERNVRGFPNEPLLAATQTRGVIRKEQYENRTVLALKDLHLLKLVETGDFVISLRSFQGGIEYARERGIISPAYTILYPQDTDNHAYLAFLFKSRPYIENLQLFVTGIRQGQNIDYERLSRSPLPLPPLPEQTAIVRFLDYMERRIRRYIRAKQKLVKLLEEYRQALIHRAVTGRIDVRTGQPYPAYKPSGVEWLGEVPGHWEVRRLSSVTQILNGATPSSNMPEYWDGDIVWVTPDDLGKLKARYICGSSRRITRQGYNACGTVLAAAGSIVLSTRAPIGHLGILQVAACANQGCRLLVPRAATASEYLYYVLVAARPSLEVLGQGSTFLELSRSKLGAFPVPFPPLPEQTAIVEYLDAQTAKIDAATSAARREIELLREYLTRLIADVVTGKVDVREVAARLPEEPEITEEEDSETFAEEIARHEPEQVEETLDAEEEVRLAP